MEKTERACGISWCVALTNEGHMYCSIHSNSFNHNYKPSRAWPGFPPKPWTEPPTIIISRNPQEYLRETPPPWWSPANSTAGPDGFSGPEEFGGSDFGDSQR